MGSIHGSVIQCTQLIAASTNNLGVVIGEANTMGKLTCTEESSTLSG